MEQLNWPNIFRMKLPVMLFILMGIPGISNAGVGMLAQGEEQVSGDLSASFSNNYWDRQRNLIPSFCKARDLNFVAGYEYGWNYFHTVFASTTLGYRRCGQTIIPGRLRANGGWKPQVVLLGGRNAGFGDITMGVRTRFPGSYKDNAAWELFTTIPTGYNNQNPSRIGRGAWGVGLGVKFSSTPDDRGMSRFGMYSRKWGWKAGSQIEYFFASKGNALRSFVTLQYAFTNTNFENTGDFAEISLINHFGFANHGAQRTIFATPSTGGVIPAATNSDQTLIQLGYSHAFQGKRGLSMSARATQAIIGRNVPKSTSVGLGVSYRWKD